MIIAYHEKKSSTYGWLQMANNHPTLESDHTCVMFWVALQKLKAGLHELKQQYQMFWPPDQESVPIMPA